MAAPFLSELRLFAFGMVPKGWVPCNGQLLSTKTYEPLFILLGTTYGGDGKETFGVPDLNARVPMHTNSSFPMGAMGGEEVHTLSLNEIPHHTHQALASANTPDSNTPENNFWAVNPSLTPYGEAADSAPMSSQALQQTGGSMAHNNMPPYLVLNICMAVEGVYPDPKSKADISDPWIGEIRILAASAVPTGWFSCNGQVMKMTDYMQLFSLIGTTYGGSGITAFNLPDLQGLGAIMAGEGPGLSLYDLGEKGGEVAVTLTQNTTPRHTHAALAVAEGTEGEPANHIWANPASVRPYPNYYATTPGNNPLAMNPGAIAAVGGNSAHNNLMPYTVLNYCIASNGTYPQVGKNA